MTAVAARICLQEASCHRGNARRRLVTMDNVPVARLVDGNSSHMRGVRNQICAHSSSYRRTSLRTRWLPVVHFPRIEQMFPTARSRKSRGRYLSGHKEYLSVPSHNSMPRGLEPRNCHRAQGGMAESKYALHMGAGHRRPLRNSTLGRRLSQCSA